MRQKDEIQIRLDIKHSIIVAWSYA